MRCYRSSHKYRHKETDMLELGQVVATPGALKELHDADVDAAVYLRRHASGDWGELDEHDAQLNNQALEDGSRVLSAYTLPSEVRIWVITEAESVAGVREVTTILLPEEY